MNPTKLALIQKEAAEALAALSVNELSWHDYMAMTLGYVLLVSLALFLLFGLLSAAPRWIAGWFTKPAPKDIPDFIRCTCVNLSATNTAGHTAALREFRRVSPKCPVHSAAGTAPRPVDAEGAAGRGGGDTREGA